MADKDLLIGNADDISDLVEGMEHVGTFERNLKDSFLGRFVGPITRRAERAARKFAAEHGADVVLVRGCYVFNGGTRPDQYKVYIDLFRYSSHKGQ